MYVVLRVTKRNTEGGHIDAFLFTIGAARRPSLCFSPNLGSAFVAYLRIFSSFSLHVSLSDPPYIFQGYVASRLCSRTTFIFLILIATIHDNAAAPRAPKNNRFPKLYRVAHTYSEKERGRS